MGKLQDPRPGTPGTPVDKTEIVLQSPRSGHFVQYRCTTWWGDGCALQYIGFITDSTSGELPIKIQTETNDAFRQGQTVLVS